MPNKALRSESLWLVRCIEPKNVPAANSAKAETDVMMILRIRVPPHGRLDLIAHIGRPAMRRDELKSNIIRLPPPHPRSPRSGQWRILAGAFVGKPCLPCGRLIRPLRHLYAPSWRLGR